MCAINGIFAYHYAANPIDDAELTRTRDHMAARGPDGKGAWISNDRRLGFGHRRLSIIDLSGSGAQPMLSADGSLVVTFNGEIYNYLELRRSLEAKGYVFTTNSDTEVLLHLYAERGADLVNQLQGMFAFAIWDQPRREVLIARDPYGIKPLYYSDDGWTFRFASQVKAILAGGGVSRDIDSAGVVGFYLWGSVPEPFTTHRAVRALPAGCTMRVDKLGAHEPKRYYSIAAAYRDATLDAQSHSNSDDMRETTAALQQAIRDSLRRHLVADVPVGAFLSAGIDSGALVGLMRDAGQRKIQTVTLSFEEYRGSNEDEAPIAAQVARLYGTQHATRVVTRSEFRADFPSLLRSMDQPTIDGINIWFVSKAARELGLKVAISGLGGDELLGGYPSFQDIPRWVKCLAIPATIPGLGRVARPLMSVTATRMGLNPKVAGALEFGGTYAGAYLLKRGLFLPWELFGILDRGLVESGLLRLRPFEMIEETIRPALESPFARVATLESSIYMRNQLLRDTDWASMAHAVEVRVPLVDHSLLRKVAPLTSKLGNRRGKLSLANAPTRRLPSAVFNRPKTGFTIPIERWIREYLPNETDSKWRGQSRGHWARTWSRAVWSLAINTHA